MASPRGKALPRWNEDRLDRDRQESIERFIEERVREGTAPYQEMYEAVRPKVEAIFSATGDLTRLDWKSLRDNKELVEAGRYLTGPPISADDLETLTKTRGPAASRKTSRVRGLVRLLRASIDPIRTPWLRLGRKPTDVERELAITSTSIVWAIERIRTKRRTKAARRQEALVAERVAARGFEVRKDIRRIDSIDDLGRGQFTSEVILRGAKCDVAIRLRDGRLLALECKASNSALNSVKRLVREVGGKAERWKTEFGQTVVTGAVLSGVYRLSDLMRAQDEQLVTLFWEHGLHELEAFIA